MTGYAWFSLVGAGLAAAAVFAIGSTRGGPDPVSLVLAGTAGQRAADLAHPGDRAARHEPSTSTASGSSARRPGADLDVFWQVLPFMLAGLVLAAVSVPGLNLLQLGDDVARSLGVHPTRHKVVGVAAVMLLTGAATAACGPIAFVGLVVPARRPDCSAGVDYRWVVPYAALLGRAAAGPLPTCSAGWSSAPASCRSAS